MRALIACALLVSFAHADEAATNAAYAAKVSELSARDANVRADPKLMRMVLSARICGFQNWRTSTLAEIGKQKHYASIGGVIDLRVMHALQQRLRALDEHIAADRAELKQRKLKAFACGGDEVYAVLACADGATWPECSSEPFATMLGIVGEEDSEIPGSELVDE
jgi:hypothetical protein